MPTDAPRQDKRILTVTELLGGLRGLLENRVGQQWVVGELSNLHRARSGHVYFTLKDEGGQIRAALFRSSARQLRFEPEEGLEVLVYGDVTVYEARGDLQIIARQLEPRGLGDLQLAFEQLRRRLDAEGLFDPGRKRAIPGSPARVGVVTSLDAAALRDVVEVTGRRFPTTPLVIAPTRVQGAGAEDEVAAALDVLGAHGEVDVILLVRGGGSLEDLQAFNTETVARAVARARVPVIAGVGHEVDVTIADLVADLRAPTPSAAAERALPDRAALASRLTRDFRSLSGAARSALAAQRSTLEREGEALRVLAPWARVGAQRARFRAAAHSLERAALSTLERSRSRLAQSAGRLDSLSPLSVLDRGYALVRRAEDGAIVRSADQVAAGDGLSVRVAEAEIEAVVSAARVLPR